MGNILNIVHWKKSLYKLCAPIIKKYHLIIAKLFPELRIKQVYKRIFNKDIDLENPKDLNEKINYLKLHADQKYWAYLADKFAVRKYVTERVGSEYLVKLYGKYDTTNDLFKSWDQLPNKFILKTNNGSGEVIIVNDKQRIDINEVNKKLNHLMSIKDFGLINAEFHYRYIKSCIIAEELLEDESIISYSRSLIDYKIWCFNGEPYYIFTCSDRANHIMKIMTYDLFWNHHPENLIFNENYKQGDEILPQPKNFDTMINVARELAKDLPIVRVDLYNIDGKIYFGEMTLTSAMGYMTYFTPEFLLQMGNQINL